MCTLHQSFDFVVNGFYLFVRYNYPFATLIILVA